MKQMLSKAQKAEPFLCVTKDRTLVKGYEEEKILQCDVHFPTTHIAFNSFIYITYINF